MAERSLQKSSSYGSLGPKSALYENLCDYREAYKAMITDIADSLTEEDVEKIVWIYDLPRKTYTPLDALYSLHRTGKLSESDISSLENLLKRIKREDIVEKYLKTFRQMYDPRLGLQPWNATMRSISEDYDFMDPISPLQEDKSALSRIETTNARDSHSASPCSHSTSQSSILNETATNETVSTSVATKRANNSPLNVVTKKKTVLPKLEGVALYNSFSSEPKYTSTRPQALHHTRSVDNFLQFSYRSEDVSQQVTRTISLQSLSSDVHLKETAEQLPVEPIPRDARKSRRSALFSMLKKPFFTSKQTQVKLVENVLHWPVKIEQIQRYIYTRKLQDKRITCSKKIELYHEYAHLKLSLHIHPYGILSDANKSVTFIVEMDHQKRSKLHQVQKNTKIELQLSIISNGKKLAPFNSREDFRLNSFTIERVFDHDALKLLNNVCKYLVFIIQAKVYVACDS